MLSRLDRRFGDWERKHPVLGAATYGTLFALIFSLFPPRFWWGAILVGLVGALVRFWLGPRFRRPDPPLRP